jgi:hypothetical protein
MVASINNEQPTRQPINLLPLTPRGQNVQVQSSVPTKLATPYIVTISPSANEKASGETKQGFFKGVFSIVVQYVANPVAVGAKWVKKAAGDAYKTLAGLFEQTNETTAKINEEVKNGDKAEAADTAKQFLKDKFSIKDIDKLSDKETLRLYYEYLSVLKSVGGFVGKDVPPDRRITAENAFDIVSQTMKELAQLKLTDAQKAEASSTAEKSVEEIVKKAPADEVAQSSTSLINAQNEIINLVNTIKDKTLRENVLAQLKDSNAMIAQQIVGKISEVPDNDQLANTFVENVQASKNIYHITCDLTETVVKMILDNRAEQNRLDSVSMDKLAQKTQIEKKEDEKTYMKKIADNRSELSKLQNQLGRLLYASAPGEEKEIKDINSRIIEDINKPKPMPSA